MRRDVTSSNEVAFADVAMAILGPILLLFLIYVITATGQRSCPPLDAAARDAAAAELVAWAKGRDEAMAARQRQLADRCPQTWTEYAQEAENVSSSSAGAGAPDGSTRAGVPPPLAGYCPDQQADIMRTAGMGDAYLAGLAGREDLLTQALARCLGQMTADTCQPVPEADLRRRAVDLGRWARAEDQAERQDQALMQRICPEVLGGAMPVLPAQNPPQLEGLCRQDAGRVTAAAGFKLEDLRGLHARRRATLELLRECTKRADLPLPQEVRLHFLNCSTEPATAANVQVPMPPELLEATLQREADYIIDVLKRSKEINRVDFFGHTDAKEVTNPSRCNPPTIQDNLDLSFQRARYIKDEVKRRISQDDEIQRRLDAEGPGALRLYAIGVAYDELKNSANKFADENRRIEIRFTKEGRGSSQEAAR